MRERELRRRCKRWLRALKIEPPLRVDVLCERLGERRGRPIRLLPHSLPVPGPFGLWLATNRADYIFYQAETNRVHQDHIILHEVGHMLGDHHSEDLDDECWRESMLDLSPDMIRRVLRRTCYDTEHEREAELVATIIMEWASTLDMRAPEVARDGPIRRLEGALGDKRGWL